MESSAITAGKPKPGSAFRKTFFGGRKPSDSQSFAGDSQPVPPPAQQAVMPRSGPAGDAQTRIADALERLSVPLLAFLHSHGGGEAPKPAASADQLLSTSPIAPYLRDDSITDILINGPQDIYIGRNGRLEKTSAAFASHSELRQLAETISHAVGRRIDPHRPLVDARLSDGSRVNIIAPPMAVGGLCISIRKFPKHGITLQMLAEKQAITPQAAAFLSLCARARVSLLVSGGTGTGKTTILNAISQFIPDDERVITIEDTAELRLQQPHLVKLETKEPHTIGERREEVSTSDLLRNSLRMRPDRIIVGEVRGIEAYDMIQAMNTGHDGSMTTVHANSPRDAIARMENLISPAMNNSPIVSVRRQIVSALNLIIQLERDPKGRRYVSSITEVVGMEGDVPSLQEIFILGRPTDEEMAAGAHPKLEWNQIMPRHVKLAEMLRAENVFALPLGL